MAAVKIFAHQLFISGLALPKSGSPSNLATQALKLFWASRSTFRRNFSSQKATFDFGMEAFPALRMPMPEASVDEHRKPPSRHNEIRRVRVNHADGCGTAGPIECAVRRTIISGLVSFDFTRDISRDRRSGESRSTTTYSAATECVRASREPQDLGHDRRGPKIGGTLLPIILKLCQIVGWNTWQSGNPCRRAASLTCYQHEADLGGWDERTDYDPKSLPVPARSVGALPIPCKFRVTPPMRSTLPGASSANRLRTASLCSVFR